MSTRTTYGYWHNRAVDGKQVCNHYAREIGDECGHPDLGVWTPLVKQDKEVERDAITREAKVAQIIREWMDAGDDPWPMTRALEHTIAIARLYKEADQ